MNNLFDITKKLTINPQLKIITEWAITRKR